MENTTMQNLTTILSPVDEISDLSFSDILTVFIYTVIGVAGIIGNMLVLIIFRHLKSRKSQVNSFILNQASADLMTSIFLISFGATLLARDSIFHVGFGGEFMCRFWWSRFFIFSCFAVSTFNLTSMSIERFIAVVLPLRYPLIFTKRFTLSVILFIWIVAPLMQWIFPLALYELDHVTASCRFQSSWSFAVAGAISGVTLFLWEYFIPVIIMLVAYISILRTLKRKETQIQSFGQSANTQSTSQPPAPNNDDTGNRSSGIRFKVDNGNQATADRQPPKSKSSSAQARRRNVTITLFIMFIMYFICWTPNQLTFLRFNLGGPLDFNGFWYHFTVFMAFVNTCINPFIYALKHKQFQKGIKDFLGCALKKEDRSSQINSVSSTVVD
ncbi:Alpha-1A adrenergic receptor [Holothuria leucospilota]|uniref:Alpha-1A adrenergic receptor n=1 Tax=Holothuria leucospilota TaxID=206669 RepID=A0A9Q1H347_HOLLE|nr:Alpha-1A adrenergic receptor [Holothuria leucospilota]